MKKKSTRLLSYEQKRVLCSEFSSVARGETVLMLSTCARSTVAGMNTGLDGRDRSGGGTLHGCRDETAGRRTRLSLKSESKGIRRRRQTERLQHARMPFFISHHSFLGRAREGVLWLTKNLLSHLSRSVPPAPPTLLAPQTHALLFSSHSFLVRAREGVLWLAKNPPLAFSLFLFSRLQFPIHAPPASASSARSITSAQRR